MGVWVCMCVFACLRLCNAREQWNSCKNVYMLSNWHHQFAEVGHSTIVLDVDRILTMYMYLYILRLYSTPTLLFIRVINRRSTCCIYTKVLHATLNYFVISRSVRVNHNVRIAIPTCSTQPGHETDWLVRQRNQQNEYYVVLLAIKKKVRFRKDLYSVRWIQSPRF